MVAEVGDVCPDAEVDVDVEEVAGECGAEGAEWEVDDVWCFELFVEYEHGAHVAEEGLHEEFVSWEDASAAVDFGFF